MTPTALPSPKERLLEAACTLFYRRGVKATGVDEIIAEAKVAKATFYYHFPSKNDLVRAYLARRHEQWISEFSDWLRQVKREGLQGVADALGLWFGKGNFNGCAFINITTEGAEDEWRDVACRHKDSFKELISARIPPTVPIAAKQKLAARALLVAEGMILRLQMTRNADIVPEGRDLLRAIEAEAGINHAPRRPRKGKGRSR